MKTKTACNLSDTSYSEHAVSNELLTRSGGLKKHSMKKKIEKKVALVMAMEKLSAKETGPENDSFGSRRADQSELLWSLFSPCSFC